MSLRNRVRQIAREEAVLSVKALLAQRVDQLEFQGSNMAKVEKVSGTEITVQMADGSRQVVTSLGNRTVGINSVGIVVNGIFM